MIINVDVSNVEAAQSYARLETGFHKLKVTRAATHVAKTGTEQIELDLQSEDGGRTKAWQTPPTSENSAKFFKTFLQSLGYTDKELSAPISIDTDSMEVGSPQCLLDRIAHVFYIAGDQSTGVKSEVKFLSPDAWAKEKASGAMLRQAAPKVVASPAPAVPPAGKVTGPSGGGIPPKPSVPSGGGLGGPARTGGLNGLMS